MGLDCVGEGKEVISGREHSMGKVMEMGLLFI